MNPSFPETLKPAVSMLKITAFPAGRFGLKRIWATKVLGKEVNEAGFLLSIFWVAKSGRESWFHAFMLEISYAWQCQASLYYAKYSYLEGG